MGGIIHGLLHLGRARLQLVIQRMAFLIRLTHTLAVDIDIIYTQSGSVEAGSAYCLAQVECLAEHRHTRGDAAVLLHQALGTAYGCLHVALPTSVVVADIRCVEGIARALKVLSECGGGSPLSIIYYLRNIVEVSLLTLIARSTDADA